MKKTVSSLCMIISLIIGAEQSEIAIEPTQEIVIQSQDVRENELSLESKKVVKYQGQRPFDALDHFVKSFVGADFHIGIIRLLFFTTATLSSGLANSQLDCKDCGTLVGITLGAGGLAYLLQNVPYYLYRFLRYGIETVLPKRFVKLVNDRLSSWKEGSEIPIALAAVIFALCFNVKPKNQGLYRRILAHLKNEPVFAY